MSSSWRHRAAPWRAPPSSPLSGRSRRAAFSGSPAPSDGPRKADGMQRTVIVRREVTDHEAVEIALVENLQREDLSPIEEAEAYRALIAATGCSQQDLAGAVGKSEAYISHTLRSLK